MYLTFYLSLSIYLSIYVSMYLTFYLSLSLSLYLYLYLYLSIYLPIYLSIYLYLSISIYLSFFLSVYMFIYFSVFLSIYPFVYLSICLSVCLSVCLFVCLSVYLPIHLSVYQFMCLSIDVSICLSVCLSVCLPVCLSVCLSTVSIPCQVSKILRLLRKSEARSCEVLRLSRKIILANLKIWYSKMQPWPPNISDSDMSFVLRLPRDMHLCRSSSPRLPWFLKLLPNPHVLLPFGKVQNPLCLPQKSKHVVLWPFWLRNVLRATTACTFSDISPCQELMCFACFDLEMRCALQERALFKHLNFQKWSETEVFLAFLLPNVLRATAACAFSRSLLPNTSGGGVLLYLFWRATTALIWPDGSAPAALASLLFDPPEPQSIGKHIVFGDFFRLFARFDFFYFFWLLSPLLLHLSISRQFDF